MGHLPVFNTSPTEAQRLVGQDLAAAAGDRVPGADDRAPAERRSLARTAGSPGSFTYYQAAADLFIFTCWNPTHTGCGTHSVQPDGLERNIAALEAQGWINRTGRGERWCWHLREWIAKDRPSARIAMLKTSPSGRGGFLEATLQHARADIEIAIAHIDAGYEAAARKTLAARIGAIDEALADLTEALS